MIGFSNTYQYFALDLSELSDIASIRDALGADAMTSYDGHGDMIKTLLCGKDSDSDNKRALLLGDTAKPIPLSDGRVFFGGYWSLSAISAFESGVITGEELAIEDIKSLAIKNTGI